MLKKTITWKDYDGVQRTEDFYFNLSKPEVIELQTSFDGGLDKLIQNIVNAQDKKAIVDIFKKIITKSYGEKSADGKRFIKSEEISTAFTQTGAYEKLFMELAEDENKASEFINAVIPKMDEETKPSHTVVPGPGQHPASVPQPK